MNSYLALERIEKKFPDFKSTFLNCFVKVSAHLKDANYIVRPSFKKLPKRDGLRWQATYNIKWPELQQFSGVGYTRKEAERYFLHSFLHPLSLFFLYLLKLVHSASYSLASQVWLHASPWISNFVFQR